MKQNNTKLKKGINIATWILAILFGIMAIFFMVTSISIKANGGSSLSIGGNEIRLVLTGSMEWNESTPEEKKVYTIKNINTNDAVYIEKLPESQEEKNKKYDEYTVGDVLTFNYATGGQSVVVTHRLVSKTPYGNGYIFAMQGDNYKDGEPSKQYIYTATDKANPEPLNSLIGRVYKVSSALGGFLTIATNKIFIVCVVIIPCAAIIVYEVIKIIRVCNKDKKKATENSCETINNAQEVEDLLKKQEEEIRQLKEQLNKKKEEKDKEE